MPAGREPAARPRARLHEGPSVDRRQQPSGAPRAGGRDPQRDHRQRRRAARRALLRARRAADDRRLRGDLRDRGPLAERRAGARDAPRRDGGGLARRARARSMLFLARGVGRPMWLGEGRDGVFFASTEARARGRRALLRPEAPQARASPRARSSRSHDGQRRPPRALPARPRLRRGRPAAGGPRAAASASPASPPRRDRRAL